MSDDIYREIILDHYRNPRNFRRPKTAENNTIPPKIIYFRRLLANFRRERGAGRKQPRIRVIFGGHRRKLLIFGGTTETAEN